eukprot:TRINITY_DN111774_c0_g1_i1.p1 TRINITY_DN111774_c0_g1~~TRINITY_DN111774_c0_g1_i1.p1  ORF type:complete len:333 (-),score=98.47 TRINITY_DN111774_c0_g1_i1:60-1016(-)
MFNQAAPGASGLDPKSELNKFLQKHCKRPITKGEIAYTVSKFGAQCQAIVKLNCLDGQEYAGHLSPDQKAAEKSAAQQALAANAHLVQALNDQSAGVKRAAPVQQPPAKKFKVAPGEVCPKSELNGLVMKVARKMLSKGDTIYTTNLIGVQHQATVQITVLPDDWNQRAWAGHLCATKQEAEQSAAEQALQDLKADAAIMAEAEKPSNNPKKKNGGKSGGYFGKFMEMMEQWYEETTRREAVGTSPVMGTVLEWKGIMGWIKPDVKPNHEAAEKRQGKVYIAQSDIAEGVESLTEGQRVKFKLYADSRGLGAEECKPM